MNMSSQWKKYTINNRILKCQLLQIFTYTFRHANKSKIIIMFICMYVLSTFGEFKYLFDEQCNFCVLLLKNSTLKMQF